MKFNIIDGNPKKNHFNKPLLSKKNAIDIFFDIDITGLTDMCFIVLRNLNKYKNEDKMFNDMIYLVSENNNILYRQKCDSTAGLNPVSNWNKRTQDAYTLKAGIYNIQPTKYKDEFAFHIINGETIGGYKVGKDFTSRHLIHKIGWFDDVDEMAYDTISQWIDEDGFRSGSGGCVTIPKNRNGQESILDFDYKAFMKMPTNLLIFEYREV
jgi:hypothetical protein